MTIPNATTKHASVPVMTANNSPDYKIVDVGGGEYVGVLRGLWCSAIRSTITR